MMNIIIGKNVRLFYIINMYLHIVNTYNINTIIHNYDKINLLNLIGILKNANKSRIIIQLGLNKKIPVIFCVLLFLIKII